MHYIVGEIYWWTFLRGLFLLLFPKSHIAVAKESLMPYILTQRVPETQKRMPPQTNSNKCKIRLSFSHKRFCSSKI